MTRLKCFFGTVVINKIERLLNFVYSLNEKIKGVPQ